MGFSEASVLSKVGLGLSVLAFVLDFIGFPSPYWSTVSAFDLNSGLFQTCLAGNCAEISNSEDWFEAAKALNIIGFLLGVGCMIVVIIYVAVKNDMKILQIVGSILGLAAGIFIVIGCAVYAAKGSEASTVDVTLNWSFALTIIGGLLYLFVGVVLLCEKCVVG